MMTIGDTILLTGLLTGAKPERARGHATPLLDALQPLREIIVKRVKACRFTKTDRRLDAIVEPFHERRSVDAAA